MKTELVAAIIVGCLLPTYVRTNKHRLMTAIISGAGSEGGSDGHRVIIPLLRTRSLSLSPFRAVVPTSLLPQ